MGSCSAVIPETLSDVTGSSQSDFLIKPLRSNRRFYPPPPLRHGGAPGVQRSVPLPGLSEGDLVDGRWEDAGQTSRPSSILQKQQVERDMTACYCVKGHVIVSILYMAWMCHVTVSLQSAVHRLCRAFQPLLAPSFGSAVNFLTGSASVLQSALFPAVSDLSHRNSDMLGYKAKVMREVVSKESI